MTVKRPPQIVGNIGLYYACFKLSELGWNVMPTSRNARGIDIICFSMDGKKKLAIQVKSLSKPNPVPLGNDLDKVMGDFWIVVSSIASGKPQAYILLPHEVRECARRTESHGKIAYWLQRKKYEVEKFEEQWDRIGTGLEA